MRTTVVVMSLSLAAASTAIAAPQVTDVDYLKASRCKGIAVGLGGVDTARLDGFLKREGGVRMQTIVERGQVEQTRARRETRLSDRQAKLTAELQGSCAGYLAGGDQVAGHAAQPAS
jgi:hypothetical protein